MKNIIFLIFLFVIALVSGCGARNVESNGAYENNNYSLLKLSNSEVERRIRDYSLDLDTCANLGELFDGIADGLKIEIQVEATNISPETPVSLKNSRESFVIQILETITSSTRTRYEIRKGKIWIKDTD